jgi:hypothetical protein
MCNTMVISHMSLWPLAQVFSEGPEHEALAHLCIFGSERVNLDQYTRCDLLYLTQYE